LDGLPRRDAYVFHIVRLPEPLGELNIGSVVYDLSVDLILLRQPRELIYYV
jgi:hypothetical protein